MLQQVQDLISYKQRISTSFNNRWNLVRDQGVGGSNPLSPTIYFQADTHLPSPKKFPP
jgi:hypothetical protein